ncbi:MAG: cytochrome c-type biogenesis protein CcmH [Metallibacterium scheffleri]|jgi:cytochrome c-type biogenesis protein CcmH|uniref:cytochrome c-type biogenesis protein n=1 Tax=Metallibacterium scheffleri TaxID=993689 RepID=UPI0026EB89D5|nr:cytochrome c-type biogenesis protein [Metallibacterium scheffleri]MCK9365657.1 cytochrome c-type biogenesis protein CcmH [Metallibacterium scheffleri]
MTHWLRYAVLGLLLGTAFAATAIDALPFKNSAQEVRFQNLTRQLRCLVCQNEDLADSNAKLAQDLRLVIFQQMQAGRSDAQIKQWLVDRYSDYVLYKPPLKPSNYALWFGPFVVLLLGALGVVIYLRRRAQPQMASAPDEEEDW